MNEEIKKIAIWLHQSYENFSLGFGWDTQKVCQEEFDCLPEENKKVMIAMGGIVFERLKQQRDKIFDEVTEFMENHRVTYPAGKLIKILPYEWEDFKKEQREGKG